MAISHSAILDLVGSCEPKLISLWGYSGGNKDYAKAKTPKSKNDEWNYISEIDLPKISAQKAWAGLVVPEGRIVCDIDDQYVFERLERGLQASGIKRITIETPNGGQFVFRGGESVQKQKAGMITSSGFICDYRLPNKGYIVLPTQDTENRRIIHTDKELDPMPAIFIPILKYDAGKHQEALLPSIITEGQRNDTLFRHACRLRAWNELYGLNLSEQQQFEILNLLNVIFTERPLPLTEIEKIAKQAEQYNTSNGQSQNRILVLSKFIPRTYTNEIAKDNYFVCEGSRGLLWHYDSSVGIWRADGEDRIRHVRTCSMEPNREEVQLDGLNFCKRCLDCIDD